MQKVFFVLFGWQQFGWQTEDCYLLSAGVVRG